MAVAPVFGGVYPANPASKWVATQKETGGPAIWIPPQIQYTNPYLQTPKAVSYSAPVTQQQFKQYEYANQPTQQSLAAANQMASLVEAYRRNGVQFPNNATLDLNNPGSWHLAASAQNPFDYLANYYQKSGEANPYDYGLTGTGANTSTGAGAGSGYYNPYYTNNSGGGGYSYTQTAAVKNWYLNMVNWKIGGKV